MDRGKRLARSNVIGKQGELTFEQWAMNHQLSANKAEIDVGLDFFCQVMSPVPGSASIEGAGPILGAQVKTVDDEDKPRLKLNRIDATDLLRQTQATCLFGIRLSDNSIHFQFLTKEFIDQLLGFLKTPADEFSIAYAAMSNDSGLFQRLLQKYTNPFEQLQLRIHLVRRRVVTAISGADLIVQSTNEDTVCEVYVPQASSAFTIDPSARERFRLQVLREGKVDPRLDGVKLHPVILDALKETRSSVLNLVSDRTQTIRIGICWQGKSAALQFQRHIYETEVAYVHRGGLRLTMDTTTKKVGDVHVHSMESELFHPSDRVPISGTVLTFFRLFKPGAVLSLGSGRDLLLSAFGDNLERIGDAVDSIPDLCKSLGLPLSRVVLADIQDEEFARTSWFLEALLLKSVPLGQMVSGFVVGPAADLPIEQVPMVPISISVPLVLNWKETGILIWLECDGEGLLLEDMFCGVRIGKQKSWSVHKTKRFQKSIYPEMWIAKEWPAIQIGSETMYEEQNWTYDPTKTLPMEAVIRKVES
jgi:hypothetical protein